MQKIIHLYIIIFISSSLFSQNTNTPILEREISIQVTNEPVKNILKKIEEQAHFNFSYSPQVIDVEKSASVFATKKSVRDALNQLFGEKIKYKAKGNYIILTQNKKTEGSIEKPKELIVSGYVYDAVNGSKLADVTVYEKKGMLSTNTDQYGYFSLSVPKNQSEIVLYVKKQDYDDTILSIKPLNNYYVNVNIKHSNTDTIVTVNKQIADSLEHKIEGLALVNWILTEKLLATAKNLFKDTLLGKVQVSFFPPISTNNLLGGAVINDYSFNIIAGYSQGVNKMELGGFLNMDRGDVKSIQLAGFGNLVGGNVTGLQAAGFMNINLGKTQGAQLAGFMNANVDSAQGLQLAGFMNNQVKSFQGLQGAGFMNNTIGESEGIQLAGFMNNQVKAYRGIQAAGFMNTVIYSSECLQFSGFCNHAVNNLKGVQAAGFYNIVRKDIDGVQVSGFFNYAKKVKGAQIGFINIADTCDGLPIGFFSFVKKGYHQIEISSDEIINTNLAFRTGVKKFHNIFSVGVQLPKINQPVWSLGYGLGTTFAVAPKWNMDLDLTSHQIIKESKVSDFSQLNRIYVGIERRFGNKFSIAAGPTLNAYFADTKDKNYQSTYSNILPTYFYQETFNNSVNLKVSVGGKIALRFL